MKTLYKLILLFFAVFMVIPKGYSQNNADPGIGILMSPASVAQSSTGILSATVGNYGNGTIVTNSLRVTISVGVNAEIIGIASGSDARWSQFSLTTGSANTIQLTNSVGGFSSFDASDIILTVKGNVVSSANGIAGNIVYINAANTLICSSCTSPKRNASQGNASNSNDNSETSLAVTCYIPTEPTKTNCWDTFTFDTATCAWIQNVTSQPTEPAKVNCWDTFSFTNCEWVNDNTPKPTEPAKVNCWDTFSFTNCEWVNDNTPKPTEPAKVNCWDTFSFTNCEWVNDNTPKPTEPAKVNCWDTFTFNTATCAWIQNATSQPTEPAKVNCWDTFTFNTTTCAWDVAVNGTIANANAGQDVAINCSTPSTTLSASGGVSYSWSPATGLSATNIANPIASPEVTTTYTVTVTAENGCTASDSVVVSVTNFIVANDDAGTPVNGYAGGVSFTNVLSNDLLNCKAVSPEDVTTNFVSSTNSGISLNGTNVIVAAGTPAGDYTLIYSICDKLNPTNCDFATVTITVTAPTIIAQDDTIAGGNGTTGNTNAGNVLNNNGNGNDTLNSANVTVDQVNLSITTPATPIGGAPVPVISTTTGQISVPLGTPAGIYTITYSICDKLNPTSCDSATVTITVTAQAIVAQDDKFIDLDGANGNPNAGNVLNNNGNGNDTLNGINVTVDQVNLTITTPATTIGGAPVPVIDATTGQVSVPVGTPAGTYTIVYQICEKLNSTNCDSATIILEVGVVFGVECEAIVVFNAISPNGDGSNDFFRIEGLDCYPENRVEIYNRWGVLVFERSAYNNADRAFKGISEGRVTIKQSEELPTGTYFYIFKYKDTDSKGYEKSGYLYLNR
jgi:gliding motility-associated-like protein